MKFEFLRQLFSWNAAPSAESSAAAVAAAPVTPVAVSDKHLVVFDFQGTLDIAGKPNAALHLFAALAKKKGCDVIIATGGDPSSAVDKILFSHAPQMHIELPVYDAISKYTARADIQKLGHRKAFIVFDNEPHMIPSYMDADHIGEVQLRGQVANFWELAALIGIEAELSERLQQFNITNVPAAAFGHKQPK